MPDSDNVTDFGAHGDQIHSKFGFYSVALVFTILGLAIQTASFGANVVSDGAELFGWALLLISGLKGLARLERLPELFFMLDEKVSQTAMHKAEAPVQRRYEQHRSAFVWGVVLLVVGRGFVPALDLLSRIWAMRP